MSTATAASSDVETPKFHKSKNFASKSQGHKRMPSPTDFMEGQNVVHSTFSSIDAMCEALNAMVAKAKSNKKV